LVLRASRACCASPPRASRPGAGVVTTQMLAFDLGAESGRAMVGGFDGARVELRELRRFPNRSVRLPDGLYLDALGLYAELAESLAQAAHSEGELRSLAVDSWAVDFG